MKFAIIADIHANLDAFQVVLEDIKQQKCTHYACLGDVVGYNANPKECLDIVRKMNIHWVKGNHDEYCWTEERWEGFNPAAAEAVNWTRKQLSPEDKQWLRDLKYVRMVTNFTIVHATLDGPQRWGYVFDKLAAAASFTYQNTSICFFGHTHVPVAFIRDSMVRGGTYSKFKVEPGKKYFINVGAIGQPRDNNPKAAYVVYDADEGFIELRRLEYDIAAAQKKILDAGLPPRLAERKPSIENFFLGGSDVVFQPAQLDETLIGVIHNVGCLGIVIAWLSDCANVGEILFARFDLELVVGAAADHTIADKAYRHMRVAEETNGGVLIRKTGGCREFVKNVAPSLRTIQSGVDYREISDHPHILQVPQPLLVLGGKLLTRPVHSLGGCGIEALQWVFPPAILVLIAFDPVDIHLAHGITE